MCAGVIEKNINGRIVFKLLTVDSYQVVYSELFFIDGFRLRSLAVGGMEVVISSEYSECAARYSL